MAVSARLAIRAALLFVAASAAAQDAAPEPPSEPVLDALSAPRETYRVGIAELVAEPGPTGVADEARIAAVTFPRLLYESLSSIREHEFSTEELRAYSERRLDAAVRDAASALQGAVDARDRLIFDREADEERRPAAAETVEEARSLLTELKATDPEAVAAVVPATLPLVFWSGHEEGSLLPHPEDTDLGALEALAETEDLDVVVWGVVDEIDGYLAIDVSLYHRFTQTSTPLGGTVARPEEVGLEAPIVARESAAALLGREYARLEVVTGDPEAAIEINGELRGYGNAAAPYLRPGAHRVRVSSEGFESAEREVELAPGASVVERVELEAVTARTVVLRSSPAGADVYADSVWIGRTPLEYTFPPTSTVVRLRRDGYLESRFVVDSASPTVMNRALLPDTIDWSLELRRERDDFYEALTWFVVSLPVTILLNGGYESVRAALVPVAAATLRQSEERRLAQLGNIFYWSSLGSTAVNVGLFVNLLISIFDYVQVGEGPHNQ
ncbi:MAG: PEGA domain-containing protein [Spirochaetales bacterium]